MLSPDVKMFLVSWSQFFHVHLWRLSLSKLFFLFSYKDLFNISPDILRYFRLWTSLLLKHNYVWSEVKCDALYNTQSVVNGEHDFQSRGLKGEFWPGHKQNQELPNTSLNNTQKVFLKKRNDKKFPLQPKKHLP